MESELGHMPLFVWLVSWAGLGESACLWRGEDTQAWGTGGVPKLSLLVWPPPLGSLSAKVTGGN